MNEWPYGINVCVCVYCFLINFYASVFIIIIIVWHVFGYIFSVYILILVY